MDFLPATKKKPMHMLNYIVQPTWKLKYMPNIRVLGVVFCINLYSWLIYAFNFGFKKNCDNNYQLFAPQKH
jgi:hypothetical protein